MTFEVTGPHLLNVVNSSIVSGVFAAGMENRDSGSHT